MLRHAPWGHERLRLLSCEAVYSFPHHPALPIRFALPVGKAGPGAEALHTSTQIGMNKLRLNLNDLNVESFITSDLEGAKRGTVHGRASEFSNCDCPSGWDPTFLCGCNTNDFYCPTNQIKCATDGENTCGCHDLSSRCSAGDGPQADTCFGSCAGGCE